MSKLKSRLLSAFILFLIIALIRANIAGYIGEDFYNDLHRLARDLVTFNAAISVGLAALLLTIFLQIEPKNNREGIKNTAINMLDNFIMLISFSLILLFITYMPDNEYGTDLLFFAMFIFTTYISFYVLWDTRRIILKITENIFINHKKKERLKQMVVGCASYRHI